MKFFTSDNHWYHTRIIRYCGRPFIDFQEMNNIMIKNWNSVVTDADTVYVIGDWIFADNPQKLTSIMSKLKGTKILILGNHDHFKPFDYVEYGFQSVHTHMQIKLSNDETVNLHHDPAPACGVEKYNPHRWLVGHVHNIFKDIDKRIINVGVDVRNFTPYSEELLLKEYPIEY